MKTLKDILKVLVVEHVPKDGEESVNELAQQRSRMTMHEAMMAAAHRLKARNVPVPKSNLEFALVLNDEISKVLELRYRAELEIETKQPAFEVQALKNIKIAAE
jgi:hypothetical protein